MRLYKRCGMVEIVHATSLQIVTIVKPKVASDEQDAQRDYIHGQ